MIIPWFALPVNYQLTSVNKSFILFKVIRDFLHKGLAELFETGRSRLVRPDMQKRVLVRLDVLDNLSDLNDLPENYRCHPLHTDPVRYSIWINGAWRMRFEWDGEHFSHLNLEQYH